MKYAYLFISLTILQVTSATLSSNYCDCSFSRNSSSPSYPWIVSISRTTNEVNLGPYREAEHKLNGHLCTGILLNSQWILTAGNCILNPKEGFGQYLMDPQYFAVSGSSSNLIEQFDLGRYDIKEIILQRTNDYQHPKLALLKLTRPIKDFGNRFKAVCIDGNSNPTNGVEVHVPGWTSYNTKISMRRQVHVNLRQSTYKLTLPTESINEAILIDENHSEPSVMDLGSPVLMPEGDSAHLIGLIHNRLYRSIANQKVHINMVARLDQSDVINWLKQTIENDYCKMQTITN